MFLPEKENLVIGNEIDQKIIILKKLRIYVTLSKVVPPLFIFVMFYQGMQSLANLAAFTNDYDVWQTLQN